MLAKDQNIELLIVEDDKTDRLVLKKFLSRLDFPVTVHEAETLAKAGKILAKEHFDLVLLDCKLPDGSGCDFLRDFNKEAKDNISFVVVTGQNDEDLAIEALRAGAVDFLTKGDLTSAHLSRAIKNALERQKLVTEKKEAQEKLDILSQNANDIVFLEDGNSKILFMSPSITRHLGYTPEEAIGVDSWSLVHEGDRKDVYDNWIKEVMKVKRPCRSEFRLRGKDGAYTWFEAVCSPVLDEKNEVEHIVSVCRNISERKEAMDRLEMLAHNIHDIVTLRDAEGKVLYVTPSFEKELGYSAEKEVGKGPWYRLVHPDDKAKAEDWLKTVFGKGKIYSGEFRLKDNKGNYKWFASVTDPIKNAEGKVVGSLTSSRNITDFKLAESETQRFGQIIEESINEIFVFGANDLKFTFANRAARENLGYSMKELGNMTPLDIKPEFTKASFLDLVKPLKNGKKKQIHFEALHQRKDGTGYHAEISLNISLAGSETVFVAIIEDITERKASQERFHQAQKMEAVGNLSGGIAHDFNNLLTAIQGSLQLIEMIQPEMPKNVRDCLDIALTSTKRGADLTAKLLAFSRKQTLKPVNMDINAALEEVYGLLGRTIGESIEIKLKKLKGEGIVFLDEALFQSALLNLAVNARDAMPDGGKLTISAKAVKLGSGEAAEKGLVSGNYYRISVADTGAGIPPEVASQIFEPFFSTKTEKRGTGLGLSMVYGFINQSNGYIDLETKKDKGTTFHLYFRAAKGEVKKKKRGNCRPQAHKTGTILLVEDDDGVRNFIGTALANQGFKVISAGDGMEAKKKMKASKGIDLLLTDVVLPKGLSGLDVGEAFAKLFPGKPIIYSSGYSGKADGSQKSFPKDKTLLAKPYDIEDLFLLIEKKLSEK